MIYKRLKHLFHYSFYILNICICFQSIPHTIYPMGNTPLFVTIIFIILIIIKHLPTLEDIQLKNCKTKNHSRQVTMTSLSTCQNTTEDTGFSEEDISYPKSMNSNDNSLPLDSYVKLQISCSCPKKLRFLACVSPATRPYQYLLKINQINFFTLMQIT